LADCSKKMSGDRLRLTMLRDRSTLTRVGRAAGIASASGISAAESPQPPPGTDSPSGWRETASKRPGGRETAPRPRRGRSGKTGDGRSEAAI
jgi:hypothetical protein